MKNAPKPVIYIRLNSPEGNIFHILARAGQALKASSPFDQTAVIDEMRTRVTSSSDYNAARAIIEEYVTVIYDGGSDYAMYG